MALDMFGPLHSSGFGEVEAPTPAKQVKDAKKFQANRRATGKPAARSTMKSPISCGSSWTATATVVDRPAEVEVFQAMPKVMPSTKLCSISVTWRPAFQMFPMVEVFRWIVFFSLPSYETKSHLSFIIYHWSFIITYLRVAPRTGFIHGLCS